MSDIVGELPQLMEMGTEREQNYYRAMEARYRFLLSKVKTLSPGRRVLDIGAEPYQFPLCLERAGYDVVGIDVDPERGRERIERHDLDVRQADLNVDRLPVDDETVDMVVFSEVFEHLFSPRHALEEINRVLSSDGVCLLTTPNLYRLGNVVRFLKGKGFDDALGQWEKRERIGHMGHVRQYSRPQIEAFLKSTRFEVVESENVCFTGSQHQFAPLVDAVYRLFPLFRPFQYAVATPRSDGSEADGR